MKKFLALILAMIMVLSLVACGGGNTDAPANNDTPAQTKAQCIKGHSKVPLEERSKNLYVAPQFAQYRREATERITSDEGCLLRMNRSIQAEGSFGQLKANMNFRRFLCFGKVSVTAEITLLAIAHNIRKLHRKIQDKRTGTHLFPLKEAS